MDGIKRSIRGAINFVAYALRFGFRAIKVHPSSIISFKSSLSIVNGGSIKIGRDCNIHPFAMLLTYRGDIVMGNQCSVNPFTILYGHGGLKIGNGVRIAAHTVVIPSNHNFKDPTVPVYTQGHVQKGVVIEDDVWIAANCTILDGVTIGKGSVVGAGSVVTKSIPEYSVVAGVPARILYNRMDRKP